MDSASEKNTEEKQIKALAELDGWRPYSPGDFNPTPRWINSNHTVRTLDEFRWYLTSYDAIIPLIRKQWEAKSFAPEKFYQAIPNYYPHILSFIQTTSPRELCEAILKATGKWEE